MVCLSAGYVITSQVSGNKTAKYLFFMYCNAPPSVTKKKKL